MDGITLLVILTAILGASYYMPPQRSLPACKIVHDRTNGWRLLLVQTFPGVYETVALLSESEFRATYGYLEAD